MKIGVGLAALAVLAGCGEEQGVGGLTAEESRQLNEAAEMLDAEPDGLVPADETGLGNMDATAEGVGESSTEGY